MKEKKSSRVVIAVSAVVIFLVACVLVIYLKNMNEAIEGMTLSTVSQLAEHDMNSIQIENENSWKSLDGIYTRVRMSKPENIQELCDALIKEQVSTNFEEVYLVDSKGRVYSGNNIIADKSEESFIADLMNGKDKIVVNKITGYRLEAERETIAYGKLGKHFEIEGACFIGIFGFSPIRQMESRLIITSFNGEGLSSVIDDDGYYIVNPNRSAGMKKRDNYFENLSEKHGLDSEDIEELKKKIHTEIEFSETYKSSNSKEDIIYHIKMDDTGWIFCTSVPATVVAKEAQPFIKMSIIMTVVIFILFSVFILIIIRSVKKSADATAAARARGDFLSNMSHEMRTPLNALIGLNDLMQRNSGDEEKMKDYLCKSGSTAKYLLSLINDILDMSTIQAGKVDICEEPVMIDSVIDTMDSIIGGKMEEKNIEFKIQSDIKHNCIMGDETHIEQILMNILGNAYKFTADNGRVVLRVSQSESDDNGFVTTFFEVEDNGCGMSADFQKKVFDSFTQERNAVKTSIKGTGIGMALSFMFAKAMGGSLSVKSELGKGSCFTLSIKNKITERKQETIFEKVYAEMKQNRPFNILVAEDNELNAEILLELLSDEGFSADHAKDGGEVVEMFEKSEPFGYDLILMDLQMPVHNGYEATEIIRNLGRPDSQRVLIYACTANTFKEDKDRATIAGMNDFIAKPIDVTKLIRKLNEAKKL